MTESETVQKRQTPSAFTFNLRAIPTAAYLAAALCFFLPFVNVSCSGQRVASLTGVRLVTGTTLVGQRGFGEPAKTEITPEPLAVAALLTLLGGAALGASRARRLRPASAALGLVALVLLLLLKAKMDADALRQGQGMLSLTYGAGFVGSCVLSLIAAGASALLGTLHPRGAPFDPKIAPEKSHETQARSW